MANVTVEAQGAFHFDTTNTLVIALRVRDENDQPVTGLGARKIRVYNLHPLARMKFSPYQEEKDHKGLEGVYRLVAKNFNAMPGTHAFHVEIHHDSHWHATLASVVIPPFPGEA